MSKHSKWAKVKHHKGVADQKKAGSFTKHGRAVAVAAREGGDPGMNFKLRMAIDAARADNVPMDNIERAIARGSGADAADQMKEVLYEGFGPGGSALLIEAVTENTNRTVSNVRHLVSKHGGNLAGSVQWMFERRPTGWVAKQLVELGAEDAATLATLVELLEEDDDVQRVTTNVALG